MKNFVVAYKANDEWSTNMTIFNLCLFSPELPLIAPRVLWLSFEDDLHSIFMHKYI